MEGINNLLLLLNHEIYTEASHQIWEDAISIRSPVIFGMLNPIQDQIRFEIALPLRNDMRNIRDE